MTRDQNAVAPTSGVLSDRDAVTVRLRVNGRDHGVTIDELSYALGRDPVELRLANDTSIDAPTGLPLSSRRVAACLRRGADRFGWAQRSMAPQSIRGKDGTQTVGASRSGRTRE